uniref:Uncharacterized protein n=1 Tax=viral metagenome TaxID=1070528 RepID=A0A6M3KEH1_9ZZZZ
MAETGTMSNLFQNKLFLQYLSGAGNAISQGQPAAPALNQITQQSIAAKSQADLETELKKGKQSNQLQGIMKMVQQMLGGEGIGDSKMTLSKDGLTLKSSTTDLENFGKTEFPATLPQSEGGSGIDWSNPSNLPPIAKKYLEGAGIVNPSASPLDEISYADLAGLTPQDVSRAFAGSRESEQIGQKSITDVMDMIYKGALTKQALAGAEASTPSITLPGTDIKVTSKQYVDWYKNATKDERTAAIKNYEYAQSEAGGKFKGSFEKFQDNARTSHGKDYEKAVEGGYKGDFNTWMLEMAKAGAITIDQRTAAQEAATALKDINYFSSPKGGLGSSIDKYINSEEVQNQLFTLDPNQRSRRKIELEANQVEREIIGAGGKITGAKMDGRTRVWTVEWPNGKTSEVKRGF